MPSAASRSDTSCGASWTPVPSTAAASASCVAKLVISVTSTPSGARSASLRSRKLSSCPSRTGASALTCEPKRVAMPPASTTAAISPRSMAALPSCREALRSALPGSGSRDARRPRPAPRSARRMRCSDSASGSAAANRARRSSNGTRSKWKRSSRAATCGESGVPATSIRRPVAAVAPGQRGLEALGGDDRVELALLGRLGCVEDGGEVEVGVDGLSQTHRLVGAVERELRQPQHGQRRRCDLGDERIDRGLEAVGGRDAVDESEALGLARVYPVAREEQLVGLLLAEHERHEQRYGARPVADLGLAEARVLGRHDHVAGHRELARAGQAPAAHGGDRRSRQRPQLHSERDVGREQVVPAVGAGDPARGLLGEIEARPRTRGRRPSARRP